MKVANKKNLIAEHGTETGNKIFEILSMNNEVFYNQYTKNFSQYHNITDDCYVHQKLKEVSKILELFGVESMEYTEGKYCDYINVGDGYNLTILYYNNKFRLGCWADIAEKYL